MNLQAIVMPRQEAAKLYEEYRQLVDGRGTEVDRQIGRPIGSGRQAIPRCSGRSGPLGFTSSSPNGTSPSSNARF